MIYKIGSLSDLTGITISEEAKEFLYYYANILSTEYGEDRDIDNNFGGYILYATPGTTEKDIKAYFDYTENLLEYVDTNNSVCVAVYITGDDYGVVIIMSIDDAPPEIKKEIKNKGEEK